MKSSTLTRYQVLRTQVWTTAPSTTAGNVGKWFFCLHWVYISVLRLFSSCGKKRLLWLQSTGSRGHTGLAALRRVESSQTRDGTHVLCNGRWILNHWPTREVGNDFKKLETRCAGLGANSTLWRQWKSRWGLLWEGPLLNQWPTSQFCHRPRSMLQEHR